MKEKSVLRVKILTIVVSFLLFVPIVVVSATDGRVTNPNATATLSEESIEEVTTIRNDEITSVVTTTEEASTEVTAEVTTESVTEKPTEVKTTEAVEEIEETEEVVTRKVVHEETPTSVNNFYDEDDLYILSHLIYGEAGGESDECQLAVGSVVLNRVKSKSFSGNTIEEIVFAPGQYACTWDGNYDKEPDSRAINNARYLLENGSQLPDGVVYQAQFVQGEVYAVIDGEYFCYG